MSPALTVFVTLLVIGAGIALENGVAVFRGFRAARWPQTTALVIDAGLVPAYVRSGIGRWPHDASYPTVRYEYVVGGRHFVGTRISFAVGVTRNLWRTVHARAIPAHGTGVTISYNPRDPANSVILPGASDWMTALFAFGIALAVVGALGTYASLPSA